GREVMSRDDIQKLLGGYATGTLTPEEQQALFEAALDDQDLFDQLAREQALRDLLCDPAAKAHLLIAIDSKPPRWWAGWWRPAAPPPPPPDEKRAEGGAVKEAAQAKEAPPVKKETAQAKDLMSLNAAMETAALPAAGAKALFLRGQAGGRGGAISGFVDSARQ